MLADHVLREDPGVAGAVREGRRLHRSDPPGVHEALTPRGWRSQAES